ncbi:hypothetical protein ACGFJ5_18450 [Micromonospora echinaurantiaca]|uniref:hypothetical protein n=1 Tax=Micromonospora echinaurantiaca TaxID=47857 RepID=UPI003714E923
MGGRVGWRALVPAVALGLLLTGCEGVGVGDAPDEGRASYQAWGLNEASSDLDGEDRTVVLNGDLERDSGPLFTVDGRWDATGFVLDDSSAEQVRALAGRLPERTGDPACHRLVLVSDGLVDRAVAVLAPDEQPPDGPVTARRLDG